MYCSVFNSGLCGLNLKFLRVESSDVKQMVITQLMSRETP